MKNTGKHTDPIVLWVSPDLDEWRVEQDGTGREEGIFDARDDAIAWARRVASRLAPAEVRVLDYGRGVIECFACLMPAARGHAPA